MKRWCHIDDESEMQQLALSITKGKNGVGQKRVQNYK